LTHKKLTFVSSGADIEDVFLKAEISGPTGGGMIGTTDEFQVDDSILYWKNKSVGIGRWPGSTAQTPGYNLDVGGNLTVGGTGGGPAVTIDGNGHMGVSGTLTPGNPIIAANSGYSFRLGNLLLNWGEFPVTGVNVNVTYASPFFDNNYSLSLTNTDLNTPFIVAQSTAGFTGFCLTGVVNYIAIGQSPS
jgi:hypothetical protein